MPAMAPNEMPRGLIRSFQVKRSAEPTLQLAAMGIPMSAPIHLVAGEPHARPQVLGDLLLNSLSSLGHSSIIVRQIRAVIWSCVARHTVQLRMFSLRYS